MLWEHGSGGRQHHDQFHRAGAGGDQRLLRVPHGAPGSALSETAFKKMCGIVWCYPGAMEQAHQILDPIRSYRKPAFEFLCPCRSRCCIACSTGCTLPACMVLEGGLLQGTRRRGDRETRGAWGENADAHSSMHLTRLTARRIALGEGHAWSHRDAILERGDRGVDPIRRIGTRSRIGRRRTGCGCIRSARGGAYVNFMMDEGEDRVRATYRGNYERLAAVKAKIRSGKTSSA